MVVLDVVAVRSSTDKAALQQPRYDNLSFSRETNSNICHIYPKKTLTLGLYT